jgi:predicted lipoprotein
MRSLLIAAALLGASLSAAKAEADHAAIAKASLTQVIRPGYATFAAAAGALQAKVETLCQQPSGAALKDAKDAFAGTVAAWSKVEIIRFGPISQDHRLERLFFWPDPKGLGLKQIQDALAKQEVTVTSPRRIEATAVASGSPSQPMWTASPSPWWRDGARARPTRRRFSARFPMIPTTMHRKR